MTTAMPKMSFSYEGKQAPVCLKIYVKGFISLESH